MQLVCFCAHLWALFHMVTSQAAEKLSQDPCVRKQACHECIQTPTCAWCLQPDFGDGSNINRCIQQTFAVGEAYQCSPDFVFNPDNVLEIIEGQKLNKAEGGKEAVQIWPQRVHLALRMNEPLDLELKYAQAEDYPVDLYYLMDLSKSMEDDKDKLSDLGDLLAESMQNITSNFRLGFGSFVDKVVMPYVSTVPKNLIEPCERCVAPYGYRNHMSLSEDTGSFSDEVRSANVSGNLDNPEGGFDAIMQAIVCKKEIGWRDRARKLLLFSTDAEFHYAGDGKLGGIVKPNDGMCHMENNIYDHSALLDYPSVSQINLKVKEHSINVIFAVTSEMLAIYDRLEDYVEGATAARLLNDSSNIVELVRDHYNAISSTVEIKDNATRSVKVSYFSNCTDGPMRETNKCDGLKIGTVVSFTAKIEVKSCPRSKRDRKQTFRIYPVGINESLLVDLEMLCDCDCERQGDKYYEENSERCNRKGTYKCGICECNKLNFGRKCECDSETQNEKDLTAVCRQVNDTVDCSGRGTCNCGVCECDIRDSPEEKIEGPYCECDNFSCDRFNGQLCSGPDHGTCICGNCKCNEGWEKNACQCRNATDTCVAPGDDDILCSGNGECECGVCKCSEKHGSQYSGRYCEKCPTCPGRCDELRGCVQCQVFKTGNLTDEECNTCEFLPIEVQTLQADEGKDESLCAFHDEENCRFAYIYAYSETGELIVRAQKGRECPSEVPFMEIIFGVSGAIVAIGALILLAWKILTIIHDRREFVKFEKEAEKVKWDAGENPIYKQATSIFKNPTYDGK